MTTKLPPRQPCWAIFDGVRLSRPGYVETIHEPVKIIEVQYGYATELAVVLCGRATRFRLASFEGVWCILEMEPTE